MRRKEWPVGMVEDARELWVKYGGRNLDGMVREMRGRGWPFYKGLLYTRRHSSGTSVGWVEEFGFGIADLGLGIEEEEKKVPAKPQRSKEEGRVLAANGHEIARIDAEAENPHSAIGNSQSEKSQIRNPKSQILRTPSARERRGHPPLLRKEGNLLSGSRRLRGVSEWETAGGGVLRAVGVGGGIAGFGAGLVVIDDPVRSRAAAESVNNREKVDDWFRNDIYTRLEPEASIILIQTRWHEDDLAGRLLKEMEEGGERWEVIRLPALAEAAQLRNADRGLRNEEEEKKVPAKPQSRKVGERRFAVDGHEGVPENSGKRNPHSAFRIPQSGDPLGRITGEALCPERYGVKALERIRRKLGGYAFAALYQQRPEPLEGGMFKRAWFKKIVDAAPAGLRWKRGYDLAVSTRTSADYTASFRVAFDRAGNLYIADGFRERVDYPALRRYIIGRMRGEAMTEHGVESAMHGKAVVQELRTVPELRRFAFREVKVTADKITRALAWMNLAEEGKVILVRGPWIAEFVDEVASFPRGRHDDQIDAVSVAVSMLSVVGGGQGRGVMFFD